MFARIAILGIGLIGSSLTRAIKKHKLCGNVVAYDPANAAQALSLGVIDQVAETAAEAVQGADLVIFAVPIGAYEDLAAAIAPHLAPGAIVSDVGSVKMAVIRDLGPHIPEGVHLVPAHPIAGTENSGPKAGFAELFVGRWAVITPPPGTDAAAVAKVQALWQAVGSQVEVMEPAHHDSVLAITSHLPHLIAYTIVGTATDLGSTLQQEVIKFSASGFRDFTRIAASDPVMWRDIFLNNREAVLDVLQRFTEDLTALQRAIRWGEGDVLQDLFTRTRAIRRSIIDAKQA